MENTNLTDDFNYGYELGKLASRKIGKKAVSEKRGQRILGIVCGYFQISKSEIVKRSRSGTIVYCRQMAHYFLRMRAGMNVVGIGQLFGMDHTSVIHSCEKIKDLFKAGDYEVRYDVDQINNIIDNAKVDK